MKYLYNIRCLHNPEVPGSNPGLATVLFLRITLFPGIIYEFRKSVLRADFFDFKELFKNSNQTIEFS